MTNPGIGARKGLLNSLEAEKTVRGRLRVSSSSKRVQNVCRKGRLKGRLEKVDPSFPFMNGEEPEPGGEGGKLREGYG